MCLTDSNVHMLRVLSFLTVPEVAIAARVCRHWRDLTDGRFR